MRVLLASSGVDISCIPAKRMKFLFLFKKKIWTSIVKAYKKNQLHWIYFKHKKQKITQMLFFCSTKFLFHQMYNNNGKLLSHYIHLLNVFFLHFCVIKSYYNIYFSYNNEPPGVRPPYRIELLNSFFLSNWIIHFWSFLHWCRKWIP